MEIDLIVLCYNFEQFIEQSINSLLKLKLPFKTNLIISDDKSQDRSIIKINENLNLLEKKFNKVIININKKNLGVKKNLELAVKNLSKNQIIILLSGDDLINANRVIDHVNIFNNNPKVLAISSNYFPIDKNGKKLIEKSFSGSINYFDQIKNIFSTPFVGATTSYRREVFKIFQYINDDTTDVDIALKAYALAKGVVCYIDKPHIDYRVFEDSLTLISPFLFYQFSEIKENQKIWFDKKIKALKSCNYIINSYEVEDLIEQLKKCNLIINRNIFYRICFVVANRSFKFKKHLFPELKYLKQYFKK